MRNHMLADQDFVGGFGVLTYVEMVSWFVLVFRTDL